MINFISDVKSLTEQLDLREVAGICSRASAASKLER
jgi:hypothetical protein